MTYADYIGVLKHFNAIEERNRLSKVPQERYENFVHYIAQHRYFYDAILASLIEKKNVNVIKDKVSKDLKAMIKDSLDYLFRIKDGSEEYQ